MAAKRETGHRVQRVVLPSGKQIEVVYFDGEPAEVTTERSGQEQLPIPTDSTQANPEALHVCPDCSSQLVHPIDWSQAGPSDWDVDLHCPNCDWVGSGVFNQEVVEAFDRELDRGTQEMVEDLKRLMRSNMEDEVESFVGALHADAILPEDF